MVTGVRLDRPAGESHYERVVYGARTAVERSGARKRAGLTVALMALSFCVPRCTTTGGLDRVRGQSGSEVVEQGGSGGGPPGTDTVPCPCNYPFTNENVDFTHDYGRTALLRATLLAREPGAVEDPAFSFWCGARAANPLPGCARLRLRVEEVLGGGVTIASGTEIEVVSDGLLPCFVGNDGVPVGEQALAQVSWPPESFPPCEARDRCLDDCANEYAANAAACGDAGNCPATTLEDHCGRCATEVEDVCPPSPPLSAQHIATCGSARLTLWEEQILFAATPRAELRVPASELSELTEDGCFERYGDWSQLPGAFPNGNHGL